MLTQRQARIVGTLMVLSLCHACGGGGGSTSSNSTAGTTTGTSTGTTTGTSTGTTTGTSTGILTPADLAGKSLSNQQCTGVDKPPLTTLPMAQDDFAYILPYGLMIGGHVTPVDHQYFSPTIFDSAPGTYPVVAMADSVLHGITTRTHAGQGSYKNQTITDYRMVFSLSCRLLYYYDLVNELAPGLQEQLNASNGKLAVRAGQVIGRIGNQTLDFAVWDTDKPLTHFLVPQHYDRESWKIYTADPLDYYDAPTKAKALSKTLRAVAPLSGRIDFDQDNRLIGNWFAANSDGSTTGYAGTGDGEYWVTHAAFAPHFLDPSQFVISIGNWPKPTGASQFISVEGSPDPANVEPATGLVKYTLANFEQRVQGQIWDGKSLPNGAISIVVQSGLKGCLLVQMLGAREMKAQAFPDQTCAAVNGFSNAAQRYIR